MKNLQSMILTASILNGSCSVLLDDDQLLDDDDDEIFDDEWIVPQVSLPILPHSADQVSFQFYFDVSNY